jgi:hypothetical protein
LPHYGENSLSPPSIALHDTFELGPPVRRHAEAIDNDVGDLISVIEGAQAPIHSDRLQVQAKGAAGSRTPGPGWLGRTLSCLNPFGFGGDF